MCEGISAALGFGAASQALGCISSVLGGQNVSEPLPAWIESVAAAAAGISQWSNAIRPALALVLFVCEHTGRSGDFVKAADTAVLELHELWAAACELGGGPGTGPEEAVKLDCTHLKAIITTVRP